MRAVVQRVLRASVSIDGSTISQIGKGLAVLIGVASGDTQEDSLYLAKKISQLRIFEDSLGKMNLSAVEVGGEALVVSQFTLLADCSRGRRPGFDAAALPEIAEMLYNGFIDNLRECGLAVQTGKFGANMLFEISNDGPVTIIIESPRNNRN